MFTRLSPLSIYNFLLKHIASDFRWSPPIQPFVKLLVLLLQKYNPPLSKLHIDIINQYCSVLNTVQECICISWLRVRIMNKLCIIIEYTGRNILWDKFSLLKVEYQNSKGQKLWQFTHYHCHPCLHRSSSTPPCSWCPACEKVYSFFCWRTWYCVI